LFGNVFDVYFTNCPQFFEGKFAILKNYDYFCSIHTRRTTLVVLKKDKTNADNEYTSDDTTDGRTFPDEARLESMALWLPFA